MERAVSRKSCGLALLNCSEAEATGLEALEQSCLRTCAVPETSVNSVKHQHFEHDSGADRAKEAPSQCDQRVGSYESRIYNCSAVGPTTADRLSRKCLPYCAGESLPLRLP